MISTSVAVTTPVSEEFNKQSHTELIFMVYLLRQELPQMFFMCVANYIYEILIESLPKSSFVGITHPVTGKKKTIMVHLTNHLIIVSAWRHLNYKGKLSLALEGVLFLLQNGLCKGRGNWRVSRCS